MSHSPALLPRDEHNRVLEENVHPLAYENPEPSGRYNLVAVDTYTQEMSGVDRAVLEGETEGFVRVHTAKGTGRIVGATVVAARAGDMIGVLVTAMTQNIGLGAVADVIHPCPTQAEAVRKVGDLYNRTRLTPRVKTLFGKWLQWTR